LDLDDGRIDGDDRDADAGVGRQVGLEERGVHDDLAASCRPRNGKGNRREL